MDQWKYRTITCSLEELQDAKGKKYKDWAITYTDGSQIVGIGKILEYEGNNGWELVNAVADRTDGHVATAASGGTYVQRYRFFFKQRA